jgi:hypothetical protein
LQNEIIIGSLFYVIEVVTLPHIMSSHGAVKTKALLQKVAHFPAHPASSCLAKGTIRVPVNTLGYLWELLVHMIDAWRQGHISAAAARLRGSWVSS